MRRWFIVPVIASLLALVGCSGTGNPGTSSHSSKATATAPAPVNVSSLPGWSLPAGVKIGKTFSGSNGTDDNPTRFTMKGAPQAFGYRYSCRGAARDNYGGEYLLTQVEPATRGNTSYESLNGLSNEPSGAGYVPLDTLVTIDAGDDVTFTIRGSCTYEFGQIGGMPPAAVPTTVLTP